MRQKIGWVLSVMVIVLFLAQSGGQAADVPHPGTVSHQNKQALSAASTTRVSVDSSGVQGNRDSRFPAITADGRYVAFYSNSSNLVEGDTNNYCSIDGVPNSNCYDIFVYDRETSTTERVSVDSSETEGNESSYSPSISADGRYVAFASFASNLVSDDTNGEEDVFLRDRLSGTTERVSISNTEKQANNFSTSPSISGDGRTVAFASFASNLVVGDTSVGGWEDVFVRDRQLGTTERVSVSSSEVEAQGDSYWPSISADGRYVAFMAWADNLVEGDTNEYYDVFVRDRSLGTTGRVSVASDGTQADDWSSYPVISADGNTVAFDTNATTLVSGDTNGFDDVFVHDRLAGTTQRISTHSNGTQGNKHSWRASISSDGRFVAFISSASNLVSGDTQMCWSSNCADSFVHDRQLSMTSRVSLANDGTQANAASLYPSISGNGRYVAFESSASNLVEGDTNGYLDAFVRDRGDFEVLFEVFLPVLLTAAGGS
jgi:Tol biopolymer transport system component